MHCNERLIITNILRTNLYRDSKSVKKLQFRKKGITSVLRSESCTIISCQIELKQALMLSKRPLEGLQPSEPGLENDESCLQHIFMSLELPDIGHSIPPLAFVKEEKIASTFEWLCFANVINQEYISNLLVYSFG